MREVIRRQHKALSLEESYIGWLRRYIRALRDMPEGLSSEEKVEQFLTDPARHRDLSASSQNQAQPLLRSQQRAPAARNMISRVESQRDSVHKAQGCDVPRRSAARRRGRELPWVGRGIGHQPQRQRSLGMR
jgi:hypothetical protein